MKTRIQLTLVKLYDPRTVYMLLLGLTLLLVLMGCAPADCPDGASGGCGGG